MNIKQTLDIINRKKATSTTLQIMKAWTDQVMKYPPVWIPIKEGDKKTADALDKICQPLFKYHTCFPSVLNAFTGSVVLISNQNAVQHMISETAQFAVMLDTFYKNVTAANSRQETSTYYKQFKTKSKDVLDALIYDLKQYGSAYNFQVDVKEIVTAFNAEKQAIIDVVK